LILAADKGHIDAVKALLQTSANLLDGPEAGAQVQAQGGDGFTVLHYAAQAGHADGIQLLLEAQSAQVFTALHWAVQQGHADVIQLLLEARAEIGSKSNDGDTPLLKAAMHGRIDAVKALLQTGANILDGPEAHRLKCRLKLETALQRCMLLRRSDTWM